MPIEEPPKVEEPEVIVVTGETIWHGGGGFIGGWGGGGGGGGSYTPPVNTIGPGPAEAPPESPAEKAAKIAMLKNAASDAAKAAIVAGITAGAVMTAPTWGAVLGAAVLAAEATFIATYAIDNIAAVLNKMDVNAAQDLKVIYRTSATVGVSALQAIPPDKLSSYTGAWLERVFTFAALGYLGTELSQPRWAPLMAVLEETNRIFMPMPVAASNRSAAGGPSKVITIMVFRGSPEELSERLRGYRTLPLAKL